MQHCLYKGKFIETVNTNCKNLHETANFQQKMVLLIFNQLREHIA